MKRIRAGFTMIELLVAIALFVTVVAIASTIFIQALRTQRQVVALMAANDNASLALEQMVREIRTGTEFTTTGSRLNFTNYLLEPVVYQLTDGAVERNSKSITANNVKVQYLRFVLLGAGVGDGQSTRVMINMGVSARDILENIVTRMQTSISSRVLDS